MDRLYKLLRIDSSALIRFHKLEFDNDNNIMISDIEGNFVGCIFRVKSFKFDVAEEFAGDKRYYFDVVTERLDY